MDFSSAAHELYGVTPDEFMATRKRLVQQARQAGDAQLAKRIGALRRPTLPAWAVNLLSRNAGEELGWLLDVGEQMREAWASGGHIGGLEQRRGELVALLVRTAGRLAREAGHPLRDDAVREVEDTLQAATVDAEVGDEVRKGRLSRPRSHAGFVPAGFAVAPTPRAPERLKPPRKTKKAEERPTAKDVERERAGQAARDRARKAGEEQARRAAARAEQAERALAEHEAEVDAAKEHLAGAGTDVRRLRRELDKAVEREEAARRRLDRAEEARSHAARAAARAQSTADEAARAV